MVELIDHFSWENIYPKAISQFDSGVVEINEYLKKEIFCDDTNDVRRLLLLIDQKNILGYISISLANIPVSIQTRDWSKTEPILKVNALGVDKSVQRSGYGTFLMLEIFRLELKIHSLCPLKYIMLSSLRDATEFYEEILGFTYSGLSPEEYLSAQEFIMYRRLSDLKDSSTLKNVDTGFALSVTNKET